VKSNPIGPQLLVATSWEYTIIWPKHSPSCVLY